MLRFTADSLALSTAGGMALLQLPTARLRLVEVSEGRPRLQWAISGATIGGIGAGLIAGEVLGRQNPGTLAGVAGLVAGGILGLVGGGVLGAILAPEKWVSVPFGGR